VTAFTRTGSQIFWGTAPLSVPAALVIADLIWREREHAMKSGDVRARAELRKRYLEITDALGPEYFTEKAA
jgi:hypothetical protein